MSSKFADVFNAFSLFSSSRFPLSLLTSLRVGDGAASPLFKDEYVEAPLSKLETDGFCF